MLSLNDIFFIIWLIFDRDSWIAYNLMKGCGSYIWCWRNNCGCIWYHIFTQGIFNSSWPRQCTHWCKPSASYLHMLIFQIINKDTQAPLINFLQILVAHHPSKRFEYYSIFLCSFDIWNVTLLIVHLFVILDVEEEVLNYWWTLTNYFLQPFILLVH